MQTKVPQDDAAAAYESQLAERAAELLPGVGLTERIELLSVMTPEDMRTSLAWLASYAPAIFDAVLVRDSTLAARLISELADDEDEDLDDEEPYCFRCGSRIGIFYGHGGAWRHWRGEATQDNPVELFDAGHTAEVAWRPAGAQ